jgi:integrase
MMRRSRMNVYQKYKDAQGRNSRDRILSVEELGLLMKHLPPHAAQVVHFAYLTGMRAGEIFNLTWDKVDLPQKLVDWRQRIPRPRSHRAIACKNHVVRTLSR